MVANPDNLATVEVPSTAPAHRTLPFAFAKRHGVLIQGLRDGRAQAIYKTGAAALSIAEVRRFAGMPVQFTEVDPETFDALLQGPAASSVAPVIETLAAIQSARRQEARAASDATKVDFFTLVRE